MGKEACKTDGRSTKGGFKNICMLTSGVTCVVCALAAVTFLIIHFIPGINATLTPIGWMWVGIFASGAIAGGTVLAGTLQKDEIERAGEYLKDLQKNLNNLKAAMSDFQAENEVINE